MVTRRGLILGAGGGALALVAAGGVWRVMRTPEAAVEPWELPLPPPVDVRLDALRHAILAPNPHNRQPWLLKLDGDDRVIVTCDLAKRLPETDPYDRQITIGFGTFIELAGIAANARGYRMTVEPFPAGEPQPRLDARPVAVLRFAPDSALPRDPLFAAIPQRRSTKTPYDLARPVTAAQFDALTAPQPGVTVDATGDAARLAPLREAIVEGVRVEMLTPRTMQESVDLMRIGAREIDAQPDGLELGGPMIEALSAVGMISRAELADPTSFAFKTGLDQQVEVQGSIPALIWVVTPANSRADQFAAGRAWARMNLAATAMGLAVHPASQTLQEFPEMAPLCARVHALLGAEGDARVQMLGRLGHGPQVPPTPRWPLAAHLTA